MTRKYAYQKPRIPHRMLQLHLAPAGAGATLPDVVDLSPNCGPVLDQGELGSCTACSGVGAAMLLSNKQIRDGVWKGETLSASVLALYWDERSLEGTTDQDAGASIADSTRAASTAGYIPDSAWPYNEDPYAVPPTLPPVATLADEAPIALDIDTVRTCLAQGFPVQFGISVYESFESPTVAAQGVVLLPDTTTEQCLGGHALFLIGYDHTAKTFTFRNSWGESWGSKGNATIPYAYLMDAELCSEMRVLRRLVQT